MDEFIAGEDLRVGELVVFGDDNFLYKADPATRTLIVGVSPKAVRRHESFCPISFGLTRNWTNNDAYLKSLVASLEEVWQKLYGGK